MPPAINTGCHLLERFEKSGSPLANQRLLGLNGLMLKDSHDDCFQAHASVYQVTH